jgi:hypothetical protein
LLQQQFKHIDSLLIPKLKWNDITFQFSFNFGTRLSVWIILISAGAARGRRSSFSIVAAAIQTHRVSSDFETRLWVWIALSCARADSQPAGGGHLF